MATLMVAMLTAAAFTKDVNGAVNSQKEYESIAAFEKAQARFPPHVRVCDKITDGTDIDMTDGKLEGNIYTITKDSVAREYERTITTESDHFIRFKFKVP